MEEHYSILIALQENLPDSYTEENLNILEQLVTRYKAILNHVADTADPENTTLYYRERIKALEAALTSAQYEHSEKQWTAAFLDARKYTEEGISALLFHLNSYRNLSSNNAAI